MEGYREPETGYRVVHLRDGRGRRRLVRVHVLVAEAFKGPRPPGKVVRHDDGNSHNDQASNLLYGTQGENILDSVRHGTHAEAVRETCPLDHPLEHPNLIPSKLPNRGCLACSRARANIRAARRFGNPLPDLRERAKYHLDKIMAV